MANQKQQTSMQEKKSSNNVMRVPEIDKMVLNCGGTGDKLEKSVKLLTMISNRKVCKAKATKRIPDFGISPGKECGCKVTIRDKEEIKQLLKRFFAAIDNKVKKRQIVNNHLSFGLKEYIEIPGLEYNRDIGILGFEVVLVFARKGRRVSQKKIKQGKYPKRQDVTKEEIIDYLNKNFKLEITEK